MNASEAQPHWYEDSFHQLLEEIELWLAEQGGDLGSFLIVFQRAIG
jgi:hypothetical protein